MTRCDRCGSDRTEYHESTGVVCRDCRYAYGVVDGEWCVTGFNTAGWVPLRKFRTEIDKTHNPLK